MKFNLFSSSSTKNSVENLMPADFKLKLNESDKKVLIDVRTKAEFESGHIPTSINIDIYSPSFVEDISKIGKNKTIFLYCRSGARSLSAGKQMIKLGYAEVYNLLGGILAWPDPLKQ